MGQQWKKFQTKVLVGQVQKWQDKNEDGVSVYDHIATRQFKRNGINFIVIYL